jgi:hypothetical protein
MTTMQLAVLAILDNAEAYEWSVQGFGVLRLYIRKVGRLHVWDSELRYPGVSMIHTHSWDLASTIIFGKLRNTRFVEGLVGDRFYKHRLLTGYQSKVLTPPSIVQLNAQPTECMQAGDLYVQKSHEIHLSDPDDGCVTLMQRREDENGEADVYWPVGEKWGTAIPRKATPEEVTRVIGRLRGRLTT